MNNAQIELVNQFIQELQQEIQDELFPFQYEIDLRKELAGKLELLLTGTSYNEVYVWLINYQDKYAYQLPIKRRYIEFYNEFVKLLNERAK